MSVRVPTDAFGRSINIPQLPFTVIEPPHSGADYDKVFINAEGDKMEGDLNMDKHKLTNIPAPKDKLDAANKAYVDDIKSRVLKSLESKFTLTTNGINKKIKFNREQDLALKNLIKKLDKKIDSDAQVKQIRSTIANTKNIPTFVIGWDIGYSITKNIIIEQMLIRSDNECWLDIQSLGYQYGIHVFERYNRTTRKHELHIAATHILPQTWKRDLIIFVRVLR